jgi:hypothetical protein
MIPGRANFKAQSFSSLNEAMKISNLKIMKPGEES